MIEINGNEYINKEYYDKDYFETTGYKSGYDKKNLRRDGYLNKAIAVWIAQTLQLGGDERILEIGCAFGWVVEQMISMYGLDAYGQDVSAYATANASIEIKHRIKECESIDIVFDGKFDLVYSIETFEHIPKPLVSEYFKNIYDCLNDDGILFCTICLGHNDDRGADIDQSHQTLQPREWWNNKLEEAGFTIRKNLEAEAYELGLQTPEMAKGEWLPREYNWHVFVAGKKKDVNNNYKIYDRRLMPKKDEKKPKLLIVGSRNASFNFPCEDFFQIDNWGNYLSYFFNAEYQSLRNLNYKDIDFASYDVLITALDHNVVTDLPESNWVKCPKKLCFLDGTLSMMVEDRRSRNLLLKLLNQADIIFAHQPNDRELANTFGFSTIECSHIFPFRFFDFYFNKQLDDDFTILCAGIFDSHSYLSSFSAFFASNFADKVIMALDNKKSVSDISYALPDNVKLFTALPQCEFYKKILSRVDLVLRMDNPAGVGRIVAEAAAGCIPAISPGDLFQIRCFPELAVPSVNALSDIEKKIMLIKDEPYRATQWSFIAREQLKASNELEFNTMLHVLQNLGFDIDKPEELYW